MQYVSKLPKPYIQWFLPLDRLLDSALILYYTIYILLPLLWQDDYFNICINVLWTNLEPSFVPRDPPRISQLKLFLLEIFHMPHCQWRFYLPSNLSRKYRFTIPSRIIGICRRTTCSSPESSAAKHWRKTYLWTEYTELNGATLSSTY